MKLYLLSGNDDGGWNTYDSAVVCAESEDDARMIHPYLPSWDGVERTMYGSWIDAKDVIVTEIGLAHQSTSSGLVLASFNAG